MNRFLTSIILSLVFLQTSLAIEQFKDSTEAYNYWAKRAAIEAIFSYMKDYKAAKDSLNPKEKLGKDDFEKKFISSIEEDDTSIINLKYNFLSDFLSNPKYDWKSCEKNIFQPLKNSIQNFVEVGALFELKRITGSNDKVTIDHIPNPNGDNINNRVHWNATKRKIVQGYNQSLNNLFTSSRSSTDQKNKKDTLANRPSEPNRHNKNKELSRNYVFLPWKTYLMYSAFLVVGIFIGGLIVFKISKNKIKSILKIEYNQYLNTEENGKSSFLFNFIKAVNVLHKQKNKYKEKVKKSEDDLENITLKLRETQQKNEQLLHEKYELVKKNEQLLSQNHGSNTEETNDSIKSDKKISKKTVTSYFSIPESDGSFKLSNAKTSNNGKNFYKIIFEESSTSGEIFYIPGNSDGRAINRYESYLKPVCEIENMENLSTAKRIELKQCGKVTLQNDRWIIDSNNKIKIKLC
ncbi:hypothetical protein ACT29H_07355 [Thermophagus sp. OGC60D27]|uniref:hypothetical protein n=1 Tax=Thermophagus sp. OGC60D27 TaxID=3458415 RepID=UPI004037B67C